jgi:GNAT superfamily N-acetyltransferase
MKPDDVQIFPIFGHTPEVWRQFCNIENDCARRLNISEAYKVYARTNRRRSAGEFAFGAYRNRRMVGFAYGFPVAHDTAHLAKLYVRADLRNQNLGIGKRLLLCAESAASNHYRIMELKSLRDSEGFYEKQNYRHSGGYFIKPLAPADGVQPIFRIGRGMKASAESVLSSIFDERYRITTHLDELRMLRKNDGIAFGCFAGGQLRGYLAGEAQSMAVYCVRQLYVDAAFRSRGAGTALLDRFCGLAGNSGGGYVELESSDYARSFYARRGFAELSLCHWQKKL